MASDTRTARYQKNNVTKQPMIKTSKKMTKTTKTTNKKKSDPKKKPKVEKKQKKRKIRYRNVLVALCIFLVLTFGISYFFTLPITNIYVIGNTYYTDQEIIEFASLNDYPSNMSIFSSKIEEKLEEKALIKEAKVKKVFRKITIQITENNPLFYYQSHQKTVLEDGMEITDTFLVPTVINYIPDTQYDQFLKVMSQVKKDVLSRISEIQYDPDEVDDARFLLSMTDGNYVYLTLTKWSTINSYISIIKEFPNQKGILYLNAGNSFEVLEK